MRNGTMRKTVVSGCASRATPSKNPMIAAIAIVDDTLLILLNAHHETIPFVLPAHRRKVRWESILDTYDPKSIRQENPGTMRGGEVYELNARSLALLRLPKHVEAREDKRRGRLRGVAAAYALWKPTRTLL